jgi:hypothetical protein
MEPNEMKNIAFQSTAYCDFQLCTVVDGLQDLGYRVFDLGDTGQNYLEPWDSLGPKMDLLIAADTDNVSQMFANPLFMLKLGYKIPKVVIHGHDRWTDYLNVPNSPVKPVPFHGNWDVMFVRDWDGTKPDDKPVYPMEFGIERRFMEACDKFRKPIHMREIDVSFFGSLGTANRGSKLSSLASALGKKYNIVYNESHTFTEPDGKWSKWVNGRYTHCEAYYEALCNSKIVLSFLGAGPNCGRTYEAYAAGAIPFIEQFPSDIIQIAPFVDEQNCLTFSDDYEMVYKIEHYLSDTKKLHDLYQLSYSFGQNHLLTKHRAQFMMDKIKEYLCATK